MLSRSMRFLLPKSNITGYSTISERVFPCSVFVIVVYPAGPELCPKPRLPPSKRPIPDIEVDKATKAVRCGSVAVADRDSRLR